MQRENLTNVQTGMTVIDRNWNEFGKVTMVMFGDEDQTTPGPETATDTKAEVDHTPGYVDSFVSAFSIDKPMPEALRERLHREGFLKVRQTTGFANKNYFITPTQIIRVDEDRVIVNTTEDNLQGF